VLGLELELVRERQLGEVERFKTSLKVQNLHLLIYHPFIFSFNKEPEQ
jgi:hypothetical protein